MKRLVRIVLWLVLAVIVLGVVSVAALYANGYSKLHKKPTNPVPAVSVPADSVSIRRGEHIASVICAGCHGGRTAAALPMGGGDENYAQIPKGPYLGEIYAPNITPGGSLARYSDGQLARAIREGVGDDGRVLVVMPSPQFHSMSDADLGALIAFLRSQAPVERTVPARKTNLLAGIMLGAGVFDTSLQPPVREAVAAIREDSTAAYGEYMTRLLACRDCHGADLRGAPKSSLAPHGPDLLTLVPAHTSDQFARALRSGQAFENRMLDPTQMPWPLFSRLSEVETMALYRYLSQGGASAK